MSLAAKDAANARGNAMMISAADVAHVILHTTADAIEWVQAQRIQNALPSQPCAT
jgi:hypothetical protein